MITTGEERKSASVSEIFFLLATGGLIMALVGLIYQRYPIAADIIVYALVALFIFKAVNEMLSVLYRIKSKDKK